MRKKNNKAPERLTNVRIDDVAAEGKCLIRTAEGVIFVEGRSGGPAPAPGDLVDIRVVNKKKQYREAVVERVHEYSDLRTEPFCEHFGTCGGCKWQHIRYDEQLRFKRQQVVDHLTRIGKVELPGRGAADIPPTLAAHPTQYYRNKLEFTCSEGRWLTDTDLLTGHEFDPRAIGFHVPRRFDKVLAINHCYLQPDPSNAIRLAVAEYMYRNNIPAYNLKTHVGFLRTLIIRTAASTGQVMVTVQTGKDSTAELLFPLLNFLKITFPEITSLNYIINAKMNDNYGDQDVINYAGLPYIEETMESLTFRIGPKSFYQTNSEQAYNLYSIARDWAGLTGKERVYDLYTGTGTIALFVAQQAKHVIGIEYVEPAVVDARINAEVNGIAHVDFLAGDMKHLLTDDLFARYGKPDVIITDPPRAGMDEPVTRQLLVAAPERIVYISCNTATQARDLSILDEKYAVAKVQPVDMFPHTHHVENVVLLVKR